MMGTNARQRTDQATRFVQACCTTEVTDMLSELVETGWQRFLDRLKQLLGKTGRSDLPAGAASATDVPGASTPQVATWENEGGHPALPAEAVAAPRTTDRGAQL
jgi:hypothetical protein